MDQAESETQTMIKLLTEYPSNQDIFWLHSELVDTILNALTREPQHP